MVIQRFQTLFLIVAAALMAAFIFVPVGYSVVTEGPVETIVQDWTPCQFMGILIPAAIAAVLLVVDVFLFRRMPLQKSVAWIAFLLILATAGVTIYVLTSGMMEVTPGVEITRTKWGGGGLLLVAAALAVVGAISRISADQRLLRSIDRLR